MGTGKAARERRIVYQYPFNRHKRDDRAINAMVDRAEKVAAGTRPLKKDRFVRIDATGKDVDWDLVDRARSPGSGCRHVRRVGCARPVGGRACHG